MPGKSVDSQASCGHHCQPSGHGLQDRHAPGLIPAAEEERVVPTVQLWQNVLPHSHQKLMFVWIQLQSNAMCSLICKIQGWSQMLQKA